MRRRESVILALLLAHFVTFPSTVRGADPGAVGPRVAKALADPGHPAWRTDGRAAVWVYFVDRELTPAQREIALTDAEALLTPAALRRRGKMAAPGERLVDEHDLPLDPEHLAAAAATGATLRSQSRWLGAASFDATPPQVRALASLPYVRRVDLVSMGPRPRTPSTKQKPAPRPALSPGLWTLDYGASLPGLELINVPPVHELGFTGSGVIMAMLDTGFRMTHEALDHVPVIAAYDFAGDDPVVDYEPGDPLNAHEHGTQVISTAMGFAPGNIVGPAYNASAILVRADNTGMSGPIEEDWWVAGLEWAEAQGADLVSSSLGFWLDYGFSDLDGDTAPSTVAADMAAARGLLVVNGAGNQGGTGFDVVIAPADGDSVVAVGMTDITGVIAIASSSGPTYDGRIKPDVVALGLGVPVVDPNNDFAYTTNGGTSFSGPFVAGVAALILERAPFLTPVQVREALRTTADRHDTPDNHYGWGMVDALAAVYYWGPHIGHERLRDTEDAAGPYTVTGTVVDQFVLEAQTPWLHYRVDGGQWQDALMAAQGGDEFAADIPGRPVGSTIEYYLEASDVQGLDRRLPPGAPDSLFSFNVWQDTIPPVLVHTPLGAQAMDSWPPAVVAGVTDNLGVAAVELSFSVNGGSVDGPYLLAHAGNLYARPIPLDVGDLMPGDSIVYTITATDASAGANATQAGPCVFEVIAGAGQILVMDDNSGGEAATVAAWLGGAGYAVSVQAANLTGAGDLVGKQAAVWLSGDNPSPLASNPARIAVRNWVAGGGRLLIEGGETGYAALVDPGYTAFASGVLHVVQWNRDSAGSLAAAPGQAGHAVLNQPMAVSPPVGLTYTSESDQDALSPAADALLVLENSGVAGSAGALVYDDNPIAPSANIVYYPFALSALTDQNQAQALVVNAIAHLLDNGMPTGIRDDPRNHTGATPRFASLVGVTPNPFTSNTLVRIEMTRAAPVRLDIYDVRGRLVRRLVGDHRALLAGPHDFAWDGSNDQGYGVSSGIYFVRLTAAGFVECRKVALLR